MIDNTQQQQPASKEGVRMYRAAPLPFVGQKRMMINQVERVLNTHLPGDGAGWTIVDAFGGSGLLSHVSKALKPAARVIYNDYDDYSEQIKHINDLNALRLQLVTLLRDVPREQKLTDAQKRAVIETIARFDGFKSVHVLGAWLLFSSKQCKTFEDFCRHSFYNCVRQSDIPAAEGWFNGFETVKTSFKALLPQFKNDPKTLFLLDPPYICTDQGSYKQDNYFDLIDFMELINLTRPPYIFFSSTKSEFPRFIDFMVRSKANNWQSFDDVQRITVKAALNYQSKYEDNIVYKF